MNELNFLDIIILKKIDADSSVEKFGSMINTSFFETANLLGTIKIKGYINIESSLGGISKVTMTDAGTSILAMADQRARDQIEPLDNAILHAIAGGVKEMEALRSSLNIRSGDLAYHIHKLVSQGFLDYEVRSAKVNFVLTEQGFNSTGGVRVQQKLATPSELMGEETAELKTDSSQAEEKSGQEPDRLKEGPVFTPPWVKPSDVHKEAKHKADVAHLLKEEHEHKHTNHEGHNHEKHEHKEHKSLTPEEIKAIERRRRMMSKLQYYVVEYIPYLLLIVIVAAIFVGAIFLGLSKLLG